MSRDSDREPQRLRDALEQVRRADRFSEEWDEYEVLHQPKPKQKKKPDKREEE